MQFLSFSAIILPVLVISLNIVLYFILLRKTTPKILFKYFVVLLIPFAFLFNVVWEILQIPLYQGGTYAWNHILFCVIASFADAIMVLLIYFGFAFLYKNALWIKDLTTAKVIFLILTGGIGAILAEILYLSIGSWSYASSMPVIPFVNTGLSPVLQFMILPLFVYMVVYKLVKKE